MQEKFLNNKISNNNGIIIPNVMMGSFQVDNYNTMREMVKAAMESNCFAFDTSPSYGSEIILSKSIKSVSKELGIDRSEIFISTKIDGWQMAKKNGAIESYVDKALKDMDLEYFDLLLIHWPFEQYLLNTWKAFERIYKSGKAKSIGICNINIRNFEKLINSRIEIKPHIVQNEISPLRVCEEEVNYFKENEIIVQAYSPLCRMINEIKESKELMNIAKKYNKSIAQIILRWHVDREIVPIFTSQKAERIKSNLDIFDFKLSEDDIKIINSLNKNYKIFPESFGCPGF